MPRRVFLIVVAALLLAAPIMAAVGHEFAKAKIVDVQHKTWQKVDMYLVNTPVMSEVPFFEMTVRLGETEYIAEYTPRHPEEELPAAWVAGADVPVQVEKHFLVAQRPDGGEIRWTILKHHTVKQAHD
jgi:hypothetical protein